MILLCVGNFGPFNRLVRSVDFWAQSHATKPVFAQIGDTEYRPENIDFLKNFTSESHRDRLLTKASLLICDLSIDTLLLASEHAIPVLALPRLSIFGEESSVDQITLAHHLKSDEFIQLADDETQLHTLLSKHFLSHHATFKNNRLQSNTASFQQTLSQTIKEVG